MTPMFITMTPLGPRSQFSPGLGQDQDQPWGEEPYSSEDYEGYDEPTEEEEQAGGGGGFDWSSILGLESAIEGFLNYIPADYLGPYKTEFEGCRQQVRSSNILVKFAGADCLRRLYQKVQSAVPPGTTVPPKSPAPVVQAEFPVLPVAIGAVALAGLGVILFTRRG